MTTISIAADILTGRRDALASELSYQQGQAAALQAAIDALPAIIADLESDIADLDAALVKLEA